MRRWILLLIAGFLIACASPVIPTQLLPTRTTIPTTPSPLPITPIGIDVQPAPTFFFADTKSPNLIFQSAQLSQTVAFGSPIEFVALREDDILIAVQPHDDNITIFNRSDNTRHTINSRCESMVWAPDGQNLLCSRFGNIYTIQSDGLSDTLTTIPDSPYAFGELVWRPDSAQLWFTYVNDTQSKICTISHSNDELLCVGDGTQPRWSPSGQWLAYRMGDSITVQSGDASQQHRITGLGVNNLLWRDDQHLLVMSNTSVMQYQFDTQQFIPVPIGAPNWRLIGVTAPNH